MRARCGFSNHYPQIFLNPGDIIPWRWFVNAMVVVPSGLPSPAAVSAVLE
jgi:hypothetical protein